MLKQTWLGQILEIFLVFCYTHLYIYDSFLCYITVLIYCLVFLWVGVRLHSTGSCACVSCGSQPVGGVVLTRVGPALLFLGGFLDYPLSPDCGIPGRHLLWCLLSSVLPSDSEMAIWWDQVCLGFLPPINLRAIQGCLLTSVEALCGCFFPVHKPCHGCRWALSWREHHRERLSSAAVLPTQEVPVVSAHSLITDGCWPLLLLLKVYLCIWGFFLPIYLSVHCMHAVSAEARRGH